MEPAVPRVQGTGGINVHEVPHAGYKEIGDTPLKLLTAHAVEHLAVAVGQTGRSATPSSALYPVNDAAAESPQPC